MMPVIRRALGAAGAAAAWEEALLAPQSSALGCPMCGRPMARAVTGAPAFAPGLDPELDPGLGLGLDLDVCRPCQLAWLDAQELPAAEEAAPRKSAADAPDDAELPDRARATLLLWALRQQGRAGNALAGGRTGRFWRTIVLLGCAALIALAVRAGLAALGR